jgi:hypothetical protein
MFKISSVKGTLVHIHNNKAHEEVDTMLHAVLTLAPHAGSYCLFSDSHQCPSNSAVTSISLPDHCLISVVMSPLFPIIPSAGEIGRVCALRTDYVTAKQQQN